MCILRETKGVGGRREEVSLKEVWGLSLIGRGTQ